MAVVLDQSFLDYISVKSTEKTDPTMCEVQYLQCGQELCLSIYIIYAGSVLFNIQLLSTSVIHKTLETLIIKSFVLPPHPVHRLQSRDTSC